MRKVQFILSVYFGLYGERLRSPSIAGQAHFNLRGIDSLLFALDLQAQRNFEAFKVAPMLFVVGPVEFPSRYIRTLHALN